MSALSNALSYDSQPIEGDLIVHHLLDIVSWVKSAIGSLVPIYHNSLYIG